MRCVCLLVVGLLVLVVAAPVGGADRSPLAGGWAGTMRPTGDGVTAAYAFGLRIDRDGRGGTWRTARCRGTLAYVARRDGFTLLRERLGSGPCTGDGIDWVRRRGSRLAVSFRSSAGKRFDSRGTLTRR